MSANPPISVHVLAAGEGGDAVAEKLADTGATVSGPTDPGGDVLAAVRAAPGADVVVVVGDLGPRSTLADALEGLEGSLPGYGEAVRQQSGAVLLRLPAGRAGDRFVFPVCSSHVDPCLAVLTGLLDSLGATAPEVEKVPFGAPPPRAGLRLSQEVGEPSAPAVADKEPEGPEPGWKRAVHGLDAEVHIGRREELPENVEKLAPVLNVLETAGEFGMMKLPSGRRYSLFGWPDLRRPTSKVLAVSWGEPLAEVVALHRHPAEAGTAIDEEHGLLPSAGTSVAEIARKLTGRAPPSDEGRLFALSSSTVWILRGRRVFKWDGSREKDDGNPKQVLASLTLHWSNQ